MADSSEPWRSPRRISWVARVLAPLALIAVVIAVVVIVSTSMNGEEDDSPPTEANSSTKTAEEDKPGPETPREYLVESGDSLTSIAEKFGVSVMRLERLNPEIDAQTLNEGTPITLR